MKLAIIGATGLVGRVVLKVLAERKFEFDKLLLAASATSVGTPIEFLGKTYLVKAVEEVIAARPDIAIFSAGGATSKHYAPLFEAVGTVVIDNSSAWRMDPTKKLIVPEVNGSIVTKADKIIANPNCSTIQMVVALNNLHKKYTINRIVVSTYQAVTGTGAKGVRQLQDERNGIQDGPKAYAYPIDLNCIPHGGDFELNGYTTEEIKLVNETRKIMGDSELLVTATVVRVPVYGGHSESINVSFKKPIQIEDVRSILASSAGVVLLDDPQQKKYPMPLDAEDKDAVFVGRVRIDETQANTINMWVVSDNLRKGAATNAVQIAELVGALINEKK